MAVATDVISGVETRWKLLRPYLDRRERSLWAAAEAEAIGYGGRTMLADMTGISAPTILARIRELRKTNSACAGSLVGSAPYRAGRGRKKVEVKDPEVERVLEAMLSDEIAGDPMTNQKWVRSSLRRLSARLAQRGHQACTHTVACRFLLTRSE